MRNKWTLKKKSPKGKGHRDTPTSITQTSKKSPRLYTGSKRLDTYTTKNVEVGCYPFLYNLFINNRLGYRRAARGGEPDDVAKLRLGPKSFRVTKKNYKTLKKGQHIYMDRDSVFFRGPFIFQRLSRGPLLNFSAKDVGYNMTYNFSIRPSHLEKIILYATQQHSGHTLKKKKRRSNHKTRGKRKRKTRRRQKRRKH